MPGKALGLAIAWSIAFAAAVCLDAKIARAVHDSGLWIQVAGKNWAEAMKAPGEILFTVAVVLGLLACRQIRGKQAVFMLLAGAISGLNVVIKWCVGRYRPYKFPGAKGLHPFWVHPFGDGAYGFFHQRDLCFPSGHECTAGALAAATFAVWPKGRWVFIAVAMLVGIERVLENAHYTSDVVGAMGFAMLEVSVLNLLLKGWMNPKENKAFEVLSNHTSLETSKTPQC
jgi:membrane-associated phospholipid phosphatase